MKLCTSSLLAVASLALAAPALSAQVGPSPDISSVPARKSYSPGSVVINGTNLGLVTQVRINGVPTPISHVRPNRIVTQPIAPLNPGIGTVQVIGGSASDSAPIEFLPTLIAIQRGFRLTLKLNNGDTGTYAVRFSYANPSGGVLDPGIYGPRYLGIYASTIIAGVFPTASTLTLTGLTIPVQVGQIGAPLQLQALCYSPANNVTAYTNLATVPGITPPQGP
jgi:hypothetical protein